MKKSLFAVALAGIANATHIGLELVDTFTGLATEGGVSESCHYDGTDMVWRFMDQAANGEVDTLSGNYPTVALFMQGVGNDTSANALGIQYVDDATVGPRLYIADGATGDILIYDITTEDVIDSIAIGVPFTNGLCYDADNDVLYATNIGTEFVNWSPVDGMAAIYKISDVSTSPTVSEVPVTPIVDQDGNTLTESNAAYIAASGSNRVFHPNGCAVLNGMVYFVETRISDMLMGATTNTGSLGVYNPTTDSFYVNTAVFTQGADGLVAYGDYLIASTWGSFDASMLAGKLWTYDTTDSSAVFEVALEGLASPADIGINDDGMICVPSFNAAAGNFYFVQVYDHNDLSTTMLDESTTGTTEQENEPDNAVHAGMMTAMFAALFALLF